MLRVVIKGDEAFNDETQEFEMATDDIVVDLEHSLLSLSKWESKYQRPFLSAGKKSPEEIFDYLKFMVVSPNVDPDVLYKCSQKILDEIQRYIDSKESATTFGHMPERRGPGEVITSELIYYWMITCAIPKEMEHWHLNRLFALIRIFNVKNSKQKPMSKSEVIMRNRELNAQRKAALNTTG